MDIIYHKKSSFFPRVSIYLLFLTCWLSSNVWASLHEDIDSFRLLPIVALSVQSYEQLTQQIAEKDKRIAELENRIQEFSAELTRVQKGVQAMHDRSMGMLQQNRVLCAHNIWLWDYVVRLLSEGKRYA